eukprot:12212261-Alexandrium_andersonii.AAC.1
MYVKGDLKREDLKPYKTQKMKELARGQVVRRRPAAHIKGKPAASSSSIVQAASGDDDCEIGEAPEEVEEEAEEETDEHKSESEEEEADDEKD